jgi:hypothetical protein
LTVAHSADYQAPMSHRAAFAYYYRSLI